MNIHQQLGEGEWEDFRLGGSSVVCKQAVESLGGLHCLPVAAESCSFPRPGPLLVTSLCQRK